MAIRWNSANKYHNKTYKIDGINFDSKKEAIRYTQLKLLQKAGKIKDLQLQKVYELIPAQYEETEEVYTKGIHKGEHKRVLLERACNYVADFYYVDCETKQAVIEDVKGYKEGGAYSLFKVKRKLMLYIHGIKIKEI